MTEQEIYNSRQYKFLKKILKQRFPWIKDLRLDGDPNEYSLVIFFDIVFDAIELAKLENLKIQRFYTQPKSGIPYLNWFYDEPFPSPTIDRIIEEIKDCFNDVTNNPTIPEEIKLKTHKRFGFSSFSYLQ